MTAVVNDAPILPGFHAWQHSLDQSQGTKEVHFKQFLCHSVVVHSNGVTNPSPALLTDEYQHALVETLRYTVSVYWYG